MRGPCICRLIRWCLRQALRKWPHHLEGAADQAHFKCQHTLLYLTPGSDFRITSIELCVNWVVELLSKVLKMESNSTQKYKSNYETVGVSRVWVSVSTTTPGPIC